MSNKARFWNALVYPENMVDDWQDEISKILQVPFAYTIHNRCTDKQGNSRKEHVHIILVFPNTTTYNHALSVVQGLSKPPNSCCNKIERVINIRFSYNYLIHDTDDCRKKSKFLYSPDDRITGNNFDIGDYEQLSISDKNKMLQDMIACIIEYKYTNIIDFYSDLIQNFDSSYFEVFKSYHSLLSDFTKGNYLKYSDKKNM